MLRKCFAVFMVVFAVIGATACTNQSSDQRAETSDSAPVREME